MKKIYLMGLTVAFAVSVNAQTTKLRGLSNASDLKNASAKGGSVLSPLQLAGSIICNTQYVAGTTMDLEFTLSLTNTDFEYADLLTIVFPTGITPNSSPNNPFASDAADPGPDGPETLNPIVGQTISWGNDDNNWGGIVANATYNFTVNVTIAAGVTGNQSASYDISGDGYGANPGNITGGTIIIYPFGTTTVDMRTKFVIPTTVTAINNCALGMDQIFARFVNFSNAPQSNIPVNYSVNGTASTPTTIAGPLAVGDSADVLFTIPYNFTSSNMYTVKAWANQSGDILMGNDTASIVISNTIPTPLTSTTYTNGIETAYDFGSINKTWIGLGLPFSLFTGTAHGGTKSLNYALSGANPASTYETFAILPCVNVTSGEIYKISYWRKSNTSGTLTVNGETSVYTGTSQDAASMTTVLKPYSAITPNASTGPWSKDSIYFTATANETRYFAVGGRGTLAGTNTQVSVRIDDIMITKAGTVGVRTITDNEAIIMFPNPTSGILNINAIEVTSSIEVINVIGEKVYSINLVKGNNTIDLSGLLNGPYFIKLNSNNQITTKKVILSK